MSETRNESPAPARPPSRREWLKTVGAAGAAAALPLGGPAVGAAGGDAEPQANSTVRPAAPATVAPTAVPREPLQALTATEADMLDAIVARLIPSDASGPGAAEAGAVRYIDRALAGGLRDQREAYTAGLAAFDRYCRMTRGASFVELSTFDKDSVLIDVETGAATGSGAGFVGSSAAFFALVRNHTLQGTFGDPFYGGNANFVGWDLIGYPGVRTVVTSEMTRLGAAVEPNHRSAYDYDGFVKATASKAEEPGSHSHGGHDGH